MNKQSIKRPRRRLIYLAILFLIGMVTGTILYWTARSVAFESYIIGDSMNPTLVNDEYTMGMRMGFISPKLKRGDIISFMPPVESNGYLYVKRIIGLPGETVVIENGQIYINGSDIPIEEPYLTGDWTVNAGPYCFEVPEREYLVLGDSRNTSYDSRNWDYPYVSYESIQAKTYFVYKPVSNFRYLY